MIVCEVFHDITSVRVIVKSKFLDRDKWNSVHHNLLSKSFKYMKGKGYFSKCYIDKKYAEERLQTDIMSLGKIYGCEVKLRRYKLLEERVSGDGQ